MALGKRRVNPQDHTSRDDDPRTDVAEGSQQASGAQAQGPARSGKKTVRRVVRTPSPERPRVTLGRGSPTRPQTKPSSQTTQKTRAKKPTRSSARPAARTAPATGNKPRFAGVTSASSRLARRARTATGDVAGATRSRLGRASAAIINTTPQPVAAAISGLVTGLLTVVIGWGFTYLFSWLRGTSTGGEVWGKATIAVMLVIAFVIGDQLMGLLRVRRSRLTSLTGMCVALTVVLAVFVDLIAGPWIWLVVPAITAIGFAAMHALLSLADTYAEE